MRTPLRLARPAILAAIAALATLAVTRTAHAQDVLAAAPAHYKVLVENEYIRVVENTLAPGEKDASHTHPAGWYNVTRGGTMKVVFADGRVVTWRPKSGEAGWSPPEAAHTSENVGREPMTGVPVEVKQAAVASGATPPARQAHAPSQR